MARSTPDDKAVSRTPSCLIVGAGPGIGQACARVFAQAGHDVGLLLRTPARVEHIVREIRHLSGRRVLGYAADAADETSLQAGLRQAMAELGEPDVLIYNAASTQRGRPTTLSTETLLDDFRVNVAGALTAARVVAPSMVRRGGGSILFTGGGSAYEPAADYAALSMGKAALRSLTYTLAQELGRSGVHVGMVTVFGFVQPGTHFDPGLIAEAYLRLHRQPKGHFEIETVYR
jgi:NAD(P)-dependent dehydrogenase (short-subunit alcohol dehydrogenase family)